MLRRGSFVTARRRKAPVALLSFRSALLASLGAPSSGLDHGQIVDQALDEIAAVLERSLDIPALARIAGLERLTA